MARQVCISIPESQVELWRKFQEIARRESNVSHVILSLVAEYVKTHGQGNPSFPLDKWVEKPEFIAFPTLGEPANPRLLAKMDMKTLIELKNNAESWMLNADLAARQLAEHQKHSSFGLNVASCPYCEGE